MMVMAALKMGMAREMGVRMVSSNSVSEQVRVVRVLHCEHLALIAV